jgi:hypothetical protein
MKPVIAKLLAEKITKDLFTDGTGDKARRLVMEREGENLKGSGWCEGAVRDKIEKYLMTLFITFNPEEKP